MLPALRQNYYWFKQKTQNRVLSGTFSYPRSSWLSPESGMDDYPRAHFVNKGYEVHLDLQTQMIDYARFLSNLSRALGLNP